MPEPVARVAELMSTYSHDWALSGGWAVDAWLGRASRAHGDVDVVVFGDDQEAFREHLAGWQLVAHDATVAGNTNELWSGRPLAPPAHVHALPPEAGVSLPERLDDPAGQGFLFEFQVNERAAGGWIVSHNPFLTMPVSRAIRRCQWALPAVVPEVLLLYKAGAEQSGYLRRRDKLDFLALLPVLSEEQREWLRGAISLLGHPWQSQLST